MHYTAVLQRGKSYRAFDHIFLPGRVTRVTEEQAAALKRSGAFLVQAIKEPAPPTPSEDETTEAEEATEPVGDAVTDEAAAGPPDKPRPRVRRTPKK